MNTLLMYGELAEWWPILSAPEDYAEEAGIYQRALLTNTRRPLRTLLELGSGGGNNASHLKARFTITLVDPSAGMLAVSRRLNPDCEHVQGDMRSVRLERRFDGVFVHDAVCYMTSERDLRAAMATAFVHCEPGGVALFAPDHVRENFRPVTKHGGHDAPDGRALRYLSWTTDPDPNDSQFIVDYAILLRDVNGTVRCEHDRHVEGLFARQDWLDWLGQAGFEPVVVVPVDHSELEPGQHEMFIARKPEAARRTTHG
jgi:trans-aconitate methyltransferase